MKNKILGLTVFILLFLVYSGCNSATYEIVEVEEPIEIKEEVKPPVSEIKEDPKPIENKFSEKQVVSRSYVIQIGAFNDEVNAEKFSKSAKNKLTDQDITLKNIDGLYKIRLGSFINKDDAIKFLDVAINKGFFDSFVVELTYVKQENK